VGALVDAGALLKFTAPFTLWFAFWLLVPHKEERFLVPAYPFLALGAAMVIAYSRPLPPKTARELQAEARQRAEAKAAAACDCCQPTRQARPSILLPLCMTIMLFAGAARATGLATFYGAPERTAAALAQHLQLAAPRAAKAPVVCVGAAWYRFPSSYFVPAPATYRFLKTDFAGVLPKPFAGNDTCAAVETNDLNRAAPGQHAALAGCDYVFDALFDNRAARDAYPAAEWREMPGMAHRLLDAARTPLECRIVFVPGIMERCTYWADVFVLKRLAK
jgi:alpha-1,2-mannosyltransferase